MASFQCLQRSGGLLLGHASLLGRPVRRSVNGWTSSVLAPHKRTTHAKYDDPTTTTGRRYYTPLTTQEEEMEKARVTGLTDFNKEQELRKLNREIAKLQMMRGINTGELYTWTGKYKALARDYGFPLVAWYWSIWGMTAVVCYGAIEVGGIDAMALVARADAYTGWDLVSQINPSLGKVGLALVVNELIEPLRLPMVIMTVKPVMDQIFPPKF